MNNIDVIAVARETAARIMTDVASSIDGKSELEIADALKAGVKATPQFYESGWYDPPPGGVITLFGKAPFDRLKYETSRDPRFFPLNDIHFDSDTVAQLHLCPVDKKTGLVGDFGLTIYKGSDVHIQQHIKQVRDLMVNIATHAASGMKFRELFAYAEGRFAKTDKTIAWMSTVHDFMQTNLGHTVPGSYGEQAPTGSFTEVKEFIQTHRMYVNAKQDFEIPSTCAFTIEARLTDTSLTLPNVYFHVIVCFSDGEKSVLTNFEPIFKATGMDYML